MLVIRKYLELDTLLSYWMNKITILFIEPFMNTHSPHHNHTDKLSEIC